MEEINLSDELRQRMTKRLPELLTEVTLAAEWLEAQQWLPREVQQRIDVIGEAAAEIAGMLRDVITDRTNKGT